MLILYLIFGETLKCSQILDNTENIHKRNRHRMKIFAIETKEIGEIARTFVVCAISRNSFDFPMICKGFLQVNYDNIGKKDCIAPSNQNL